MKPVRFVVIKCNNKKRRKEIKELFLFTFTVMLMLAWVLKPVVAADKPKVL